jgi:hypothetical protein
MKLKFHYKTAATGTAVNWCDATVLPMAPLPVTKNKTNAPPMGRHTIFAPCNFLPLF